MTVARKEDRASLIKGGLAMLVLTRKCHESVVVGGDDGGRFELRVTVIEVRCGKVRLGFETDPGVGVQRLEVWARMRAGTGQPARIQDPRGASEAARGSGPIRLGEGDRAAPKSRKPAWVRGSDAAPRATRLDRA